MFIHLYWYWLNGCFTDATWVATPERPHASRNNFKNPAPFHFRGMFALSKAAKSECFLSNIDWRKVYEKQSSVFFSHPVTSFRCLKKYHEKIIYNFPFIHGLNFSGLYEKKVNNSEIKVDCPISITRQCMLPLDLFCSEMLW